MKEEIQKLREKTGAGVIDCKKALEEAKGDFDRAVQIIQEKGLSKVEKRSGRSTGAGIIHSYVHNGRIGVLLDVRAETDFVVRSEPFQELVHELAMQIAAMPAENVEELVKMPYIKDEKRTVNDIINDVIAKVGENVQVNAFHRIEI